MDHFSFCRTCARPIVSSTVVTCYGPCRRQFHPECAGFWNQSTEQLSYVFWFCGQCHRGLPLPRSVVWELSQDGAEEAETMTVMRLPEEVLEMIFRYLNYRQLRQVRRTCHRWKGVVDGSTVLTRKFCLRFPRDVMMDRDYHPGCLLPAGAVQIEQARIVTIDPWWSLLSSKLVDITLNDCIISLPGLANMLRQTLHVKHIDFDTLYCPEIYDVATLANFQLNQMEALVLTNCVPSIHDLLGSVCSRLTTFHTTLTQANGDEMDPDSNEKLEYLEKWQSTLESILITPTESTLSAISTLQNLRLTSLTMACNFIRTDQLIPFLQRQQNLKILEIVGIRLTDSILCDIGRILPGLTDLVVENNQEAAWNMSFLNAMPNLEQFRVVSISPPTTESTIVHFHGCHSRKLQEIELYGMEPADWYTFQEFLKEAPNLHSVTLNAIEIDEWSDIFETLPMTKLRSLSLASITNVSDVANDSLVEYYENLRRLKLDQVAMCGQTLRVLFRLCPHLEDVSLSHMASLDDVSVLVLCQKLKRLADLTIEECPITDASIQHIIDHCSALERLNVRHCPGVAPAVYDIIVGSWLNEMMGRVMVNKFLLPVQR